MTVQTFGETLQDRMEIALAQAGLTEGQLVRKMGISKLQMRKALLASDFDLLTLADLVEAAGVLDVDARWLARGLLSPAALAATAELDALAKKGKVHTPTLNKLRASLMTMAQPELAQAEVATCRYCGCTPMMACADGCEWLDSECTICSACLEKDELD